MRQLFTFSTRVARRLLLLAALLGGGILSAADDTLPPPPALDPKILPDLPSINELPAPQTTGGSVLAAHSGLDQLLDDIVTYVVMEERDLAPPRDLELGSSVTLGRPRPEPAASVDEP